ncbi:MAG: glycosyltransferase family 1 protein, partial [Chitinophagaceae bacterium]|nr:glycosyltransferase family 1 protein [Chitinophagaceae bacterium]
KGTDIIEATLEKLSKEGIEFEFISVRNMPNKELLKLLSQADILIDEIVFNGPGALSFEGMLSGCAVATRYIEDSPEVFRPPVWNINAGNIYYKLKKLLTDRDLRIRVAEEGREIGAVANNDVYYIVKGMLADLEFSRPYDYIPAFLRENYQPCSKTEIELINHWTDVVKDCAWYKKNVKTGIRAELIF